MAQLNLDSKLLLNTFSMGTCRGTYNSTDQRDSFVKTSFNKLKEWMLIKVMACGLKCLKIENQGEKTCNSSHRRIAKSVFYTTRPKLPRHHLSIAHHPPHPSALSND